MKIENVPFFTQDWDAIPLVEYKGVTGSAFWQTLQMGDIRLRKVEYTAGYLADHWCSRGHILLVLEGELMTELEDGRRFVLQPCMPALSKWPVVTSTNLQ